MVWWIHYSEYKFWLVDVYTSRRPHYFTASIMLKLLISWKKFNEEWRIKTTIGFIRFCRINPHFICIPYRILCYFRCVCVDCISFISAAFKKSCKINWNEDIFRALTVDQLRRPMVLILGLWALVMIIIILEHIIFKWMYWRGCRIHYFNRNQNHNRRYRNILNCFRIFIGIITNRFRR